MIADRPSDRLDANGSGERDVTGDAPKVITVPRELFSGDHRKRLGRAVWLYLHLHKLCQSTGVEAGTSFHGYTHEEAAKAFNRSVRAMKVWMARLVKGGYVTTRAIPDGLIVTITGYVAHTTIEGTQDAC